MHLIYCVEDDDGIRELIAYAIESSGLAVREFANGAEFEKALDEQLPDLILLDIMLPDKDGMQILKDLKDNDRTRDLPVIFLSAKNSELDKVKGLNLGADDYITKPFSVLELISRVKAVLRRSEKHDKQNNEKGIKLDNSARTVYVNGNEIQLTYKEFELLKCLMDKKGSALSRDFLLTQVWGYDFEGESRTLDVHIGSLRHKLGDMGSAIETVRNVGYRFTKNV